MARTDEEWEELMHYSAMALHSIMFMRDVLMRKEPIR